MSYKKKNSNNDISNKNNSNSQLLSNLKNFLSLLDPFTYVDKYIMPKANPNDNKYLSWIINLIFAFIFAGIIYLFLGLLFGVASPIVIVFSESMEPNLYRGDVVFLSASSFSTISAPEVSINQPLSNSILFDFAEINLETQTLSFPFSSNPSQKFSYAPSDVEQNSIITYNSFFNLPIIHRAIVKVNASDGQFIITKGDNNPVPDNFIGNLYFNNRDSIPLSSSQIPIVIALKLDDSLTQNQNENQNQNSNSNTSIQQSSQAICLCNKKPSVSDISFPEQFLNSNCSICTSQIPVSFSPVNINDLQGSSFGKIPYVGCIKLWLFDDLISLLTTGHLPENFKGIC